MTVTLLLRATGISHCPVVSIATGEAVADVKDVLYSPEDGRLTGFTLNKHGGLFAGPLKTALLVEHVYAVGEDAVMVDDDGAIGAPGGGDHAPRSRNVIGNEVLTDGGTALGVVTDLIVRGGVIAAHGQGGVIAARATGRVVGPGADVGQVVGYQVRGTGEAAVEQLVPLPYALAVSGTHLVVPATVQPFLTTDLAEFGGNVDEFRAQLS